MEADVLVLKGSGPIQHKHVGALKYGEITMACGPGMSRVFYDWVSSAFGPGVLRKNGAVVALDHSSKPVSRMEVREALVTSLVLPELNKSNSVPAMLMITMRSTSISMSRPSGQQNLGLYNSSQGRTWRTSDFRLTIAGLETACLNVTRIEALKVGEEPVVNSIGEARRMELEPGKKTVPDLVLEVPTARADPFYDWFNDFVIKGNDSADREKEGSLDFLPPGSANPYFTLKLKGLGIYAITRDNRPSAKVKIYCEEMAFSAGRPAIH